MSVITGVQTSTGNTTYVDKKNDALGRDDFLKMFLAQLNHQDPLNPMDEKDMSAQLAQFSSLEQLYNVNENLATLQSEQEQNTQVLALNYIGKEIVAESDQLWLAAGKSAKGGFNLANKADCTVTISDQKGNIVRQVPLDVLDAGEHPFTWDGKNASGTSMPAGAYSFTVKAVDVNGKQQTVATRTYGQVSTIQFIDNKPYLYIGNVPIALEQIISIMNS
jgi:flagellar basal-body rod modification protein FlgD